MGDGEISQFGGIFVWLDTLTIYQMHGAGGGASMIYLLSALFIRFSFERGIFLPSRLHLDFSSFEKGVFLCVFCGKGCDRNNKIFEEVEVYLCQLVLYVHE